MAGPAVFTSLRLERRCYFALSDARPVPLLVDVSGSPRGGAASTDSGSPVGVAPTVDAAAPRLAGLPITVICSRPGELPDAPEHRVRILLRRRICFFVNLVVVPLSVKSTQ